MKYIKAGIAGAALVAGFTDVQAKMVSGIVELRSPGSAASDTAFDFSQAALCKSQSEAICSPKVLDFFIDSVGLHSPSSPRLEDWGPIGLDSGNINIYAQDSMGSGQVDLQRQLDSTISDLQASGDTDAVEAEVPWDQVQPGEIFEAITIDGHYAILVPIGDYQGDGYSKHAFYWTYQDNGSSDFFDNSTAIHSTTTYKKPIFPANSFRVDGLGRVSSHIADRVSKKVFLVPSSTSPSSPSR